MTLARYVHAYFAYDSKKAGGCTISHLRFGPEPIDSPYEITAADYVGCSQPTWIHKCARSSKGWLGEEFSRVWCCFGDCFSCNCG